jgi:hypothetical protein
MEGSMTRQDGIAGKCKKFPLTAEVVELMLLLPKNQFVALESIASRLNLTVGQLLRRTVSNFLRPAPGDHRVPTSCEDT